MTFYHTNPIKDLKLIVPQGNYQRGRFSDPLVFLSTKPIPHPTLGQDWQRGFLYIYKVEVTGPGNVFYEKFYSEYYTPHVCHVKRLVKAVKPWRIQRTYTQEQEILDTAKYIRDAKNRNLYRGKTLVD